MRLLITAGPTHEPIDAVRYLGNRSSGRVGIALADAAAAAGHEVTLLLGPTHLKVSDGVTTRRYATTAELAGLLDECFGECDVLVMAAAVSDYVPVVEPGATEAKLSRGAGEMTLRLKATPDLVAGVAGERRVDQRVVAFALEPAGEMVERGRAKLERKGVDALVANALETPESEGIDAAWLVREPGGGAAVERSGAMDKRAFGGWLLERVERLVG
ncbi:MAG: phosphopantothenoylcysteine decarboxylase [Planctomycetota bacterium]